MFILGHPVPAPEGGAMKYVAVLSQFDEVAIRSHVMVLAHRRTRECLAADQCSELATM
jgi:hypothetical protein